MKALAAGAAVFLLLGSILGFFFFRELLVKPGPLETERIVAIEPGSAVRKIAAVLEGEGAIEDAWVFIGGARLRQSEGPLKAGEYRIPARASALDIITLLQSGKTHQRQLTVPEGLMSVEIVSLVNAAEAMTGEVTEVPAEGSLLPETYSYTRGDDRNRMIARMKTAMEAAKKDLWEKRDADTLLRTPEEAVILASVVEKETGIASERSRVAGVFVNRLKTGMPLQSDPTVIYALTMGKEKLARPLLRGDLDVESPYNTYINPGLPPGPIANPGKASLAAVLSPEAHEFFYFVADGTGGHAFAKDHDGHLRNVGKWRAVQRQAK